VAAAVEPSKLAWMMLSALDTLARMSVSLFAEFVLSSSLRASTYESKLDSRASSLVSLWLINAAS